jgi:transcription-repair coupling factor (superfamily II helicase)
LTTVFLTGLEEALEFLVEAFPDVKIAVAHGKVFTPFISGVNCLQIMIFCSCVNLTIFLVQQFSKQLEESMEKFVLGETKILVSTSIVESGLDIQNANTIIIQEVQLFGLAQLYQVLFFLI